MGGTGAAAMVVASPGICIDALNPVVHMTKGAEAPFLLVRDLVGEWRTWRVACVPTRSACLDANAFEFA